jgi:ABC-type uncharacterized transport system permease subunit
MSILPVDAFPEQSRGHVPLPYQNHERQSAILACGTLAILPALQIDVGWLIIIMLLSSLQKTVH